ncbi:MAG: CopG family ribbon-helix-helix protein [Deltaproteobacteria bacterium]|nr:CopG family ribbon-helix-helix protein [Deltaproteobacteria bacterium]
MATHPTSVKLDEDTRHRIESLAKAKRRTPHWMMREAILQYIDREEKRESFKQDALAAWQEYQETGLHASASEAEKWLGSWGDDDELSAPKCHK